MNGTFLDKILSAVRQDLARRKEITALPQLEQRCSEASPDPPRRFRHALQGPNIQVIAEVKNASPSRGRFPSCRSSVEQARMYAEAGAACISVVTEPRFFEGSLEMLSDIRQSVSVPLLRKDFIVDPYQILEARLAGADAILLITAALDDLALRELQEFARTLGLDVLVEVADERELARAVAARADLIGVNNRDLRDFRTDISRSLRLAPYLPSEALAVSESGIHDRRQIEVLHQAGFRAFLVGEHLMLQEDPASALRELLRAGEGRPD